MTTLLLRNCFPLLTGILVSVNTFAQSDYCSSPTLITPGTACTPVTGTLYQATVGTPSSTCGTTYDVWYAFTMPASSSSATIDVTPTGNNLNSANTFFEAFSGSACSPTLIGNCTAGGSTLLLTGLSATTYYVRVYTTTNPTANPSNKWNFTICVTCYPLPGNDDGATATTLSPGTTYSNGSVWGATGSSGVSTGCASGNPDDDVWYKFTAASSITSVALSSVGSNLSASGAMVQLFDGSWGSLYSLACGNSNLTAYGLTPGNDYYLRVYSGGTGSPGGFPSGSAFSITVNSVFTPTNDDYDNAFLIPTSTTCYNSRGTLTGATATAAVPIGSCTGNPDDDVWYKFVATTAKPTITLSNLATSLSSSGARLQLLYYSGSSFTPLSCGTSSITASALTVGNTYYVRVYSNGSSQLSNATFDICVTDPGAPPVTDSTSAIFNSEIVGTQLGFPWEITYGPDDSLWITEARGYRVVRMSASRTVAQKNVAPQQILKIPLNSTQVTFGRSIGTWPQGGMEGLAIHPEFMTNSAKRWVYIAYVYDGTCPSNASAPCIFRSKIIRCQFYFASDAGNPTSVPKRDTLVILDTVISNLSGSNDHNSGRMKISPVKEGPDNTYKLYYTIGDMGAGQFNNLSRTNYAQTKDTCEGKVIRLNTEPDTDGVPGFPVHDYDKWRRWIPNDNPFTHSFFTTVRTPVFSYGHRNPQGLVWGNVGGTWRLYSSEHGDRSDDEVNIIQSGKNYGWPKVAGFNDDNYTTADNNTDGFTQNDLLAGQSIADEAGFVNTHADFTNPIFSFFAWPGAQIETINTGNIFTWPTVAPSSIDFYGSAQIPGWKNSLLVTSLKYGMFRLKLTAAGDAIDNTVCINAIDTFPLLHSWRVRDIALSPDGTTIWAVIDSSGSTSGPTGGFNGSNSNTKDGGDVIKLTVKNITVLPAEFLGFEGRLTAGNEIELKWTASVDMDHQYFEVEKSIDHQHFISIGRVDRGGEYQLLDHSPSIGNNFYRVKQVSTSGRVVYSKIININYHPASFTLSLFPNPATDGLHVQLEKQAEALRLEITDLTGRKVYGIALEPSAKSAQIPLQGWASGLYMLKVVNSGGESLFVQKFLKQ